MRRADRDQYYRIEEALQAISGRLARLEDKLDPVTPGGIAGVAADAKAARSSAEAASSAVQGLAVIVANPERGAAHAAPDAGAEGKAATRPGLRTPPRTPREQM